MLIDAHRAPGIRRARIAVTVMFLANGIGIGLWAASIPRLQQSLGLSNAALGIGLLAFAAGSLAAMLGAGWAAARFGSYRCSLACGLLLAPLLVLPALATGLAGLMAAGLVLGLCNGGMDVAMNAHATLVERARRAPIMSSVHAGFSIGGLLGSVAVGLLASAGLGDIACRLIVAGLIGLLLLACAATDRAWQVPEPAAPGAIGPIWVRPSRTLLAIGGLAFLCMLAEGAMADWSGVYLASVVGASDAVAAAGFAAFSVAMAAGRLTGDRIVRRLGGAHVLGLGGLLAGLGVVLALAWPGTVPSLAGFAMVGLGLANIVPVLFSAAGQASLPRPSLGVAAASTIGYAGFLCGPPLIGLAAQGLGLRAALTMLVVAAGLLVAFRSHAAPAAP